MKKFFFLALIVLAVVFVVRHYKTTPVEQADIKSSHEETAAKVEATTVAGLNGELMNPEIATQRPIAVVVENHPDARPQSGLTDADIVYEALAEGGITRFLAIFQTKATKNIGPVRSARTYFGDIANEWGAVLAHVGGNSDALANIKAGEYKNISDADQFFNDPYFHRISSRRMPHNVYTSIDKLRKLIADHKFSNSAKYESWKYADVKSTSTPVTKVAIDFSSADFAVAYTYHSDTNSYTRVLAGKPHKDADTGKQIQPRNIIVQLVKIYPVQSDTPLAIGMDLKSSGKAYAFVGGQAISGTWKYENGRTVFYDQAGNTVILNRGQTWVELVPDDGVQRVTWK